jgi:hypothetical protein
MNRRPPQDKIKNKPLYESPTALRLGDLLSGGGGPTGTAVCSGNGSGDLECIDGPGASNCNTGLGQ